MRRRWLVWSLVSVLSILAGCGRTDTPTTRIFEAVTPATTSQPAPSPTAPTPTTVQAVPATAAPAPPPTQPVPQPTSAVTPGQRVQVTGAGDEGVNMRGEPSTSAPPIKGLFDGDQLAVVGEDRQADGRVWRNVKDPVDDAVGWVAADFLTTATD
jgi:hypothetical protein